VPGFREIRPIDPVAINLPRSCVREISMPDMIRVFRKNDAMTLLLRVDRI
jgi:hypothetical protein